MSLVLRGDLRVRSEASTRKDARMARQTLTPLLCSDLPLGDRWVCGGVMARAVCSPRFLRQLATDCAWHGVSRSLVWPGESNPREGHPGIRVLLRETALSPVPLRGGGLQGPSRPFEPLGLGILRRSNSCIHAVVATSLRLVPLRNTSARPSDGDGSAYAAPAFGA